MVFTFTGSDGPVEFLATGDRHSGIVWIPVPDVVTDRTGILTDLTRDSRPRAHPVTNCNSYAVPRWKWSGRMGVLV